MICVQCCVRCANQDERVFVQFPQPKASIRWREGHTAKPGIQGEEVHLCATYIYGALKLQICKRYCRCMDAMPTTTTAKTKTINAGESYSELVVGFMSCGGTRSAVV